MLRVVLFSVLMTVVLGDCGVLEAQLVKQQWAKAMGDGQHRTDFAVRIFNELFHRHAESRALFDRVRGDNPFSPQFRAHAMRVLGGMDLCIGSLDQNNRLNAGLDHLKTQHVERKIPTEYWPAFKEVVLDIIPEDIGLCFSRDAWSHCLDVIIEGITV